MIQTPGHRSGGIVLKLVVMAILLVVMIAALQLGSLSEKAGSPIVQPPAVYADKEYTAISAAQKPAGGLYEVLSRLEKDGAGMTVLNGLSAYLAEIARWLSGDTGRTYLAGALGRAAWHHDALVREPRAWRLKPVHFYGELVQKTEVAFPDNPAGLRRFYLLTLFDNSNYTFLRILTPSVPQGAAVHVDADARQGVTQKIGSGLAGDGVFLMSYAYDTGAGYTTSPLIYAPGLSFAKEGPTPPEQYGPVSQEKDQQLQKPLQMATVLDRNFLRSVVYAPDKDGDGNPRYREMAADLRDEKTAWSHVLQYLWGLTPEQVHGQPVNPEINYVSLMSGKNAPQWMAGEFTQMQGAVMGMQTLRFHDESAEDGIHTLYLLTVADQSYRDYTKCLWVVACLNLPAGLRQGDRIHVDGIFYKLYPLRMKNGGWRWAPLLLSRGVQKQALPSSPLIPLWLNRDVLLWLIPVILVLCVVGGWLLLRQVRMDSRMLLRLRKNRSRKGGAGHPLQFRSGSGKAQKGKKKGKAVRFRRK